jgi:hypothetical protein
MTKKGKTLFNTFAADFLNQLIIITPDEPGPGAL